LTDGHSGHQTRDVLEHGRMSRAASDGYKRRTTGRRGIRSAPWSRSYRRLVEIVQRRIPERQRAFLSVPGWPRKIRHACQCSM